MWILPVQFITTGLILIFSFSVSAMSFSNSENPNSHYPSCIYLSDHSPVCKQSLMWLPLPPLCGYLPHPAQALTLLATQRPSSYAWTLTFYASCPFPYAIAFLILFGLTRPALSTFLCRCPLTLLRFWISVHRLPLFGNVCLILNRPCHHMSTFSPSPSLLQISYTEFYFLNSPSCLVQTLISHNGCPSLGTSPSFLADSNILHSSSTGTSAHLILLVSVCAEQMSSFWAPASHSEPRFLICLPFSTEALIFYWGPFPLGDTFLTCLGLQNPVQGRLLHWMDAPQVLIPCFGQTEPPWAPQLGTDASFVRTNLMT